MRFKEYSYLTKDLPLKIIENIDKDFRGQSVSLSKNDTVIFVDVGNDNEIIVKLIEDENIKIPLNKRFLAIDYNFIPFPFYKEDLQSIYDNESIKLTRPIQEGMRFVTGEDANRVYGFYNKDIGGGQIVEVVKVSVHQDSNGYFLNDILVKDQFGNLFDCFELYIYDESKIRKDITSISNPLSQLGEGINVNITKQNINILTKKLIKHMEIGMFDCPEFNEKELSELLIDTLIEFYNE